MRILIAALAATFLVACTPPESEADRFSEGCDARGVSQWAVGPETFSVEATTTGPDCARAVATLAIRTASGEPLYTTAHVANDLMTLRGVADPAAMQTALGEWVDAADPTVATTNALPEWGANEQYPVDGEFPFYPVEGFDRAAWEAMRTHAYPVFCYVQGLESLACIIYGDGGIEHIGVQTFPG